MTLISTDIREESFLIKFLWLQEQETKAIRATFCCTLGNLTESLPTLKQWFVDSGKATHPVTMETHSLGRRFVKSATEASVCFSKEYCESFRHQSVNSKGSPHTRIGTPKLYSKMGPHSPSEAHQKESVTQSRLLLVSPCNRSKQLALGQGGAAPGRSIGHTICHDAEFELPVSLSQTESPPKPKVAPSREIGRL
jgi:hypothetical protein